MADFTIQLVDDQSPEEVIGTTGNPWVITNNNDDNCEAALVTTLVAAAVAILWEDERKDAINEQTATENEILDCFQADLDQYCNVDHPQQLQAIDTALSIPECEIECSPCIANLRFELKCVDDDCTMAHANAQISAGLMRARHLDRQFAKERFANCSSNRRNHLIRATNLSFVDYSKAYQYFANASTIHGSLAGMAAQAYGTAVSEFSYGLGVLGRGSTSGIAAGGN